LVIPPEKERESAELRPARLALVETRSDRYRELTDRDDLFEYLSLLRSRGKLLATCALIAATVTFVVTTFLMTPYYRATALLRPVAVQSSESLLQGIVGGPAEVFGTMLGMSDAEAARAQEYVAILRSYQFTLALLDSKGLATEIDPPRASFLGRIMGAQKVAQWQLYSLMQKRFDCEYDRLTGNLTLHFIDPDPMRARQILGLYIENLRSKVRTEEVRSADAAIQSLTDEARSSPDTLLQAQIYELLAHQIQREKLARVNADFAFEVIDPPVVPDKPFTPRVVLDSVLSAVLALFLLAFGLLSAESFRRRQGERKARQGQ
jgi:hypothetical protein